MRTKLEIDNHILIISRDSFTGALTYTLDGNKGVLQKALTLDAQFVTKGKLRYELQVGNSKIIILHERPRVFAAFRDHTFTIIKNGEIIKVVRGR